jgi:cytoskeletal protein RodZ
LMGKNVDHRADLYAVGVLFYELLTGDVPRGAWRPPSNCRPMDSGLDQVVQRALQPKPEERYQRADEVQRDLTTVLQRKVPPVRRSWKRPALILSLTALAGLAGAWGWTKLTAPAPASTSALTTPSSAPSPALPPAPAAKFTEPVIAKAPEPAKPALPDTSAAPLPKPDPTPATPPATTPVVSKIQSAISVLEGLPDPAAEASSAPVPAASADASQAKPLELSAMPEGSMMLLDFSQAVDTQTSGAWSGDVVKTTEGSLTLATRETAPGAITWALPGGPVDLSGKAAKHWQIEASLTAVNSRAVLLSLEDEAGRTRSWRLKGDSFFQEKIRRHAHRLPLAEAELKSLTSGFGPRFDTPGFDLSKIVRIKLEPDPAGDAELPLAWKIYRIWLLP